MATHSTTKTSRTKPKAKGKPKREKAGRPPAFKESYIAKVHALALSGAVETEIAQAFGVTVTTLTNWKKKYPAFLVALRDGKDHADSQVVASLFHRATGYSHADVHISNFQGEITATPITKHYPPDTTAAIFWLKNRRPKEWRDKIEHTGPNGKDLVPLKTDQQELARRIAFLLSKAIQKGE